MARDDINDILVSAHAHHAQRRADLHVDIAGRQCSPLSREIQSTSMQACGLSRACRRLRFIRASRCKATT